MDDDVLAYKGERPPVSRWAVVVFWAAVVGAFGFIFVVPSLAVMLAALAVRRRLALRMDIGGQRYASAAVVISVCSILCALMLLILLPSQGRRREYGPSCSANLRSIAQSMNLYANGEGDTLPVVAYAPYMRTMNEANGTAVLDTDEKLLASYYREPFPQAGSVQAGVWMLVANGQVSPKQFLCKSDSYMGRPAEVVNAAGKHYDNFQNGTQLSYSFAYPWLADGRVGKWWKADADASVVVAADMTPGQATGIPARNLTPGAEPRDQRTWNSKNHEGEGQNVAFADGHTEFVRHPDVGQDNDNIYAMSGNPSKGPGQFRGIPAGAAAPVLMAEKEPFDIVLLPVRY